MSDYSTTLTRVEHYFDRSATKAVYKGLALSADGTLSGTPADVGSYSLTVIASDSTTGSGNIVLIDNDAAR